ncbi:hypothetical protein [Arthrobacter sp. JCM 19049]|uniref:hypothetical protein n=1 Tax=Arthrobacter sp. JCM 19049 TaxID=1460643 RepID=UPI002436BE66|nr:hypothetical protein [Arthrobacter sp. JCM 19049]
MSDLQKRLGYRHPIFNASMAGAAGGQLAAAVSTAGGVGMIGVPAAPSPQWIEEQLSHVRELPTPWGAGFMGWALEQDMGPLQAFLNERPSWCASASARWAAQPRWPASPGCSPPCRSAMRRTCSGSRRRY